MSKIARGPLIIISGPTATGKSTLIARLLAAAKVPLRLSVSATTRAPRPGEKDGVHYYFWTRDQFEKELSANGFLEHAQVHGNYYGTLRNEVDPFRAMGIGIILDIDLQGARQVRNLCPEASGIFIQAPSLESYEDRLRKRGTETEDVVQRRLAAVHGELAGASEYEFKLINSDIDQAASDLDAIVGQLFERETDVG